MNNRRLEALRIRQDAAILANQRPHPTHRSNSEEYRYRNCENKPTHLANFTKGLPHDVNTGIIVSPEDYQQWIRGIDSGESQDFPDIPLGPQRDSEGKPYWTSQMAQDKSVGVRAWESQGAGLTFDLLGPDAQAFTMPPAPTLDSQELVTEMMEVYSMALLRDVPFSQFDCHSKVQTAIARLNNTPWIQSPDFRQLSDAEESRLRGPFTLQNVFRGITPGDDIGPYISQFLLVGTKGLGEVHDFNDGFIQYGALHINQKVRTAAPGKDYMTTWEAWVDVQNGADVRGLETYCQDRHYRFMTTPRDLATYVHYDALYQAYLNACFILLGLGVDFDAGIPFQLPDDQDKQQGFAQFGPPHILTLLTEVATRALKAVRFQKFNVHRRLRPEAVGGWVHRYANHPNSDLAVMKPLVDSFGKDLLQEIASHNDKQNQKFNDRQQDKNGGYQNSFLLPMAFPEGSPMHPAYGAGHGTVAGACVTILKAFFDHGAQLPFCYQANPSGEQLETVEISQPLTVEGELNKLCSNISIGRNWAGVHYFTDYIESIRLGEQIALGILEEQKLTYGENFSMTVPLFDGSTIRI